MINRLMDFIVCPECHGSHLQLQTKYLVKKNIYGHGIETGALYNPLWVLLNMEVKYVYRYSKSTLISKYLELGKLNLINVNIVDDGEKLSTIPDNSLDFIIYNHMLEHCQNPIGTIRNHIVKLKRGGILYYAIPNKNFTFDKLRKLTNFKHLLNDDNQR